jgi:hypothetical protein
MSADRYFAASLGQVSYGIESSKYSKASDLSNWFGFVTEDVEPPNPNPHTAKSTGGQRRGPYALSPDAKEYELEVPFEIVDHNAPLEVALGQRTTTAKDPDGDSTDEYNEHLITEQDKLPTLTLQHQQEDADLQAWYIGGKANLEISAQQGEAVTGNMSFMFPKMDFDDAVTSGYTSLSIPQKSPFRFWMKGDVELTDPADDSSVKTVATVSGFSCSWDNGLEVNHHGDGRDGYSVKETTGAEKYDHSLTVTVVDTDLYRRAAENKEKVDVEIPITRDPSAPTPYDAMYIRLLGCKIVDAPMPNPSEGDLEADIALQPTNTEIEIREPLV